MFSYRARNGPANRHKEVKNEVKNELPASQLNLPLIFC
jgi:hypothetical protein